jgi:NAD(P)-dependent dehydrogenase (short-subunit alcohol dehydrogenase family)
MGLPEPPELGASALPKGTFEDQTVVVTGGGTGLGKAMAVEFARLGARIGILSRGEEHRDAGIAAVEAVGSRAVGVACDVRQPDQIAAAFDAVTQELGAPETLINNAAGNFPVPAEDMSPNAWRSVVDIVLNGTFYCSREFARRHLASATPGCIVNIGASYAWTGGPGFAHSSAAKAGVKNMTESLAVEWGPYGIRVNALVPGLMPHEDEVSAIRGVARLGGHVPGVALRALHQRTHPGGGRRELAAARHADARVHADPRSAGQGTVHAGVNSGSGRKGGNRALARFPFS